MSSWGWPAARTSRSSTASSTPAPSRIADSACGYAAYTGFPDDRDVLTVDLSISLLTPAAHPEFVAVGRVICSGRTLTICRGEVYGIAEGAERTLMALIQATMMAVTRITERVSASRRR